METGTATTARSSRPTRPTRKTALTAHVNAQVEQMDDYIRRLADGSVYVAEATRQAAQRHLADLDRVGRADFPFYFDVEAVKRAFRFCALLRHVRGDIAGEPLVLDAWQLFFVGSLAGWKRKGTKARRWSRAYVFIPRGNSKTTSLSAVSLDAAFYEGGQADVFACATKREQAMLAWGDARTMLQATPGLADKLGVEVGAHALVQTSTNSSYKPLPSESKSLDGLNPSFVLIDELHEVRPDLARVITSALAKRASSVMVAISTAGFDSNSFAHGEYKYVKDILAGRIQDDSVFGLIYEMPEGADPWAEETWRAANPMYGTAIKPDKFRAEAEKAKRQPTERANFLVKNLGVWLDSASPWMDMSRWDACADPKVRREDFEGKPCVVGLDLATRRDLCAKVLVFPELDDEGRRRFTVFCDTYLHETAVQDSANDNFQTWAEQGFITATPGEVTDLGYVKRDLLDDRDRFQVREVCFDPYMAALLSQELQAESLTLVETRQTVQVLSPAMRAVEAAVYDNRLRHDGNPVLRYCVANVIARRDANDNVFPRKENEARHIDAASALFDAFVRAPVVDASGNSRPRVWSYDDLVAEDELEAEGEA